MQGSQEGEADSSHRKGQRAWNVLQIFMAWSVGHWVKGLEPRAEGFKFREQGA